MPVTQLMRESLRKHYQAASDAHPGLLLQRGYEMHEAGNADNVTKTDHIRRVCGIPASDFYKAAYGRWVRATADATRFALTVMRLETRLFIGLSGSGALETGCAIHHSYGVPYIPGSSVKGVVNSWVRACGMEQALCDDVFGAAAEPDGDPPDGLAGLIGFHDAWWVPDSATTPLVEEVVTTHHPRYYGEEGAVDATDFDSPIPNAQVAVRGRFLFTLDGPQEWLALAIEMLEQALAGRGIGAKTRAGYGVMEADNNWKQKRESEIRAATREAMSAPARAIEDLKALFDNVRKQGNKRPGDLLGQRFSAIIEEAREWPPTDKQHLVELLNAINKFLEGDARKRKGRIDMLRDSAGSAS